MRGIRSALLDGPARLVVVLESNLDVIDMNSDFLVRGHFFLRSRLIRVGKEWRSRGMKSVPTW